MSDRTFEYAVRDWLDDGSDRTPRPAIDAVLLAIKTTPQERGLRIPRRFTIMTTYARLAAGVVAAIAIGAVLLILNGRPSVGPGSTPEPTVTAPPAPSADSSSGATAWWLAGRDGCAACAGPLSAGEHSSSQFEPGLTYTVPSGWVNSLDAADGFELVPDTAANRAALAAGSGITSYLWVVGNLRVGGPDCTTTVAIASFKAADIVQGLAQRPGIDAAPPVTATVGGLSGKELDFALARDWTATCQGDDTPGVGTLTNRVGYWGVIAGERQRVIVLDDPQGGNVVIEIAGPDDGFADHLAASMAIVDTFAFAPSP